MKIGAIIAEYNPLHNGHMAHLKSLKKICDAVVIVMSGHLMQRGEFSIFNKWIRTKAALNCGADLVLEIPAVFSCTSAEKFAHSAIKIVKELNCVSILSFGSELGKLEPLKKLAKICQTIDKTPEMKNNLKTGLSYPAARAKTISDDLSTILKYPNNTLAMEYMKACLNLNYSVDFHTIKRIKNNYSKKETNELITNSKFIRNNLNLIKYFVPEKILELYKKNEIVKMPEEFLFMCLRLKTLKQLKILPDISEGIENRIFKASKKATNLNEFFKICKTKRYTLSRIRRLAIYALLDLNKNKISNLPTYTKILGFNTTGRKIASYIKKNKNFLITSNFKKISEHSKQLAEIDSKVTDLIFAFQQTKKPCGAEYTTKPIIV